MYEKLIDEENIRLAIKNASKGKRNRATVKEIYENMDYYIPILREYAINFIAPKHVPKEIYDGVTKKKRTIIVPEFKEQVVHHMLVNVMMPLFMKGMYEHSYSSIPNRGGHAGKRLIENYIKNHPKECKYYLKMDIKKFYPSMNLDILKSMLSKKIKDKRFLKTLFAVIDSEKDGLPLGFYTSQWLANWYLQGLDHYIKEDLKVKFYIRYADDMVIFDGNKRFLHKVKNEVEKYLKINLDLKLKENWQVVKFHNNYKKETGRYLDYMGFKFYRNRTTIRRSIFLRATRKANKIGKKRYPTVYDARQMLSYTGWFKHTNSRNAYRIWIKPYVNIGKLKSIISRKEKSCSTNQKTQVKKNL